MKLSRSNAIISVVTDEDLTGKEGHFIRQSNDTTIALVDSALADPLGVLLTEGGVNDRVSIALSPGGLCGTVRVRLAGNVQMFQRLQLAADGRVVGDLGELARVVVGMALESGKTGEPIEAVIFNPEKYAS